MRQLRALFAVAVFGAVPQLACLALSESECEPVTVESVEAVRSHRDQPDLRDRAPGQFVLPARSCPRSAVGAPANAGLCGHTLSSGQRAPLVC